MVSITLGLIGCDWTLSTHSIDPRQLLGELQKDGNNDGLPVHWRAKKLQDGHLPLHVHLPLLLLHLSQHVTHLLSASQPPQTCEQEEWPLEKMKDQRLNEQSGPYLSWPGAPGSGRCKGSVGSRGRKAKMTSEAQSEQQLDPAGPATSPRCPVRPPDPRSAQGEGPDAKLEVRETQRLPIKVLTDCLPVL